MVFAGRHANPGVTRTDTVPRYTRDLASNVA
jgi:hypothetical protein